MKKLLMILAILTITTTITFAYTGYVRSPEYGYLNNDGIRSNQNSTTYYDGISTSGSLNYSLYVETYGEAQIDVGGGRTWRNGTPNSYQNGFFTGPFSYVFLTAYVNGPGGYAYAYATW